MTFFDLWPLTGRSDNGVPVDTFARLSMPHTLTLLFRSFEVVWNFDLFLPLFLGQRSNAGQSHMTSAGAPSAHPDQVWYKIGWIEHDTKRYWSSYEFYKISCETRSVEHDIFKTHSEINIFEYRAKKSIQFYHYYVQNPIFLYFDRYHWPILLHIGQLRT